MGMRLHIGWLGVCDVMKLFVVEALSDVHHSGEVGAETGIAGEMLADLWLEAHEVTVDGFSFTEIVEDGTVGLELDVILGDRTALLELVQFLAGEELGITVLETLAQERAEMLPWILTMGCSRDMNGPFGRETVKQHDSCNNTVRGREF